jgi:uncharacterized membrane protein (UPF0127 family)
MLKQIFRILFLLILTALLLGAGYFLAGYFSNQNNLPAPQVKEKIDSIIKVPKTIDNNYIKLANTVLLVEVMDTQEQRRQGLSSREKLSFNQGMFFVFDEPAIHSFWMKEMNFPLDIIWFDENKEVVDITLDTKPEGVNPKKLYKPKSEAKYALEVLAGFTGRYNIVIGDRFDFCLDDGCL